MRPLAGALLPQLKANPRTGEAHNNLAVIYLQGF